MSTRMTRKHVAFGLCLVFSGILAVPADAADSEGKSAARPSAHAGASKHRSYTQTTQTQRTADGRTTNTVRTDAQGRTSTRDATVVNDKTAGTRQRDVTYTGPSGKTRTVDDTIQKTENGHTRNTVITDAQGRETTRNVDVVRDADTHTTVKTVTVDRTPPP